MTARYKATGIDPGDTGFRLGNSLEIYKSSDAVNTPVMYGKLRGMGWMNQIETIDQYRVYEELFSSDVILNRVVTEPSQRGDAEEEAVLMAALLIAVPDARFGFGLSGGAESLSLGGCYRSLGTKSVDLREGSKARDLVTQVFNYLRQNAYWVDDDLVHMLALLTDLCQDRNRRQQAQVLSLSTSGNHRVDAGLFHAYQMVEALLGMRDRERLSDAIARWNRTYSLKLNADEIDFIRDLRDIALHFKAQRAEDRLRASRSALGFDRDRKREMEFRGNGQQNLLRKAMQAYVLARSQSS